MNLDDRLKSYIAAADWKARLHQWPIYAAATAAALATATSAEASTIYFRPASPITMNIGGGIFSADTVINIGGLGSLGLHIDNFNTSNGPAYAHAGMTGLGGAKVMGGSQGGHFFLDRLNSGDTISNGRMFQSGFNEGRDCFPNVSTGVVFTTCAGPWIDFDPIGGHGNVPATGFAGFQLATGELGWIRLTFWNLGPGNSPTSLIATDWAYNSTPGASILAGQTTDVSSPVPEPASLSLIALGAAGIVALRKRLQAGREKI